MQNPHRSLASAERNGQTLVVLGRHVVRLARGRFGNFGVLVIDVTCFNQLRDACCASRNIGANRIEPRELLDQVEKLNRQHLNFSLTATSSTAIATSPVVVAAAPQ